MTQIPCTTKHLRDIDKERKFGTVSKNWRSANRNTAEKSKLAEILCREKLIILFMMARKPFIRKTRPKFTTQSKTTVIICRQKRSQKNSNGKRNQSKEETVESWSTKTATERQKQWQSKGKKSGWRPWWLRCPISSQMNKRRKLAGTSSATKTGTTLTQTPAKSGTCGNTMVTVNTVLGPTQLRAIYSRLAARCNMTAAWRTLQAQITLRNQQPCWLSL